jgi:acyl carrier protein
MATREEIESFLKDYVLPTDSLELMESLIDIEDKYDIVISINELKNISSKDQLIELVRIKSGS